MAQSLLKSGFLLSGLMTIFTGMIPSCADWLSRLKLGSNVDVDSERAVKYYKLQVTTALTLHICSGLLTPIVANILLGDSCLRYASAVSASLIACGRFYLEGAHTLQALMNSWHLGQTGYDAYRAGFCSSQLVSDFSYVWTSKALLDALLRPSLWLLAGHPNAKALKGTMTGKIGEFFDILKKDCYQETLEHSFKVLSYKRLRPLI